VNSATARRNAEKATGVGERAVEIEDHSGEAVG
jgi:hypothetical protein